MSKTRKIMTYVMLGMMILSNFQNRLYAEEEEGTNTEVSSITSVNSPDFVGDSGLSSTSSDEENSDGEPSDEGNSDSEGENLLGIQNFSSANFSMLTLNATAGAPSFKSGSDSYNEYTISFSATPGGSFFKSGDYTSRTERSESFDKGIDISSYYDSLSVGYYDTFYAHADQGYAFSGWINTCGTTLTDDCSIIAEFVKNSATINFSATPGGYFFKSGSYTSRTERSESFDKGTSIWSSYNGLGVGYSEFYAQADQGYDFSGWINTCGSSLTEDCSIVAEFVKNGYTINFSATPGGSFFKSGSYTSPTEQPGFFSMGTRISTYYSTLTVGYTEFFAVADQGYKFSGWNNTCGTTLTDDCSIIAEFIQNSATINFSATPGGYFFKSGYYTSRTERSESFDKGTSIWSSYNGLGIGYSEFYAQADQGYEFSGWINTCGTTLTDDCSIIAEFVQNEYTIDFSATPGGYFFKSGYDSYTERSESFEKESWISTYGNELYIGYDTFYAQADQGYAFSGWINTCGEQLTEDCSVIAEFVQNSATISFSATPGGYFFKSGSYTSRTERSESFDKGTWISSSYNGLGIGYSEFYAQADQGYAFSGWINTCGETLTDDCSIVAEFVKNEYLISLSATTGGSFYFKTGSYTSLTERAGSVNKEAYISINNNNLILGYYYPIIAQADQGYEFSGWNNTCGETLTDDCTIIAEFTKKSYLVTWEHPDGYSLSESELEYGTVPVYTGTIPTKETVAGHKYTFKGWTDGTNHYNKNTSLPAITEDTTFTAEFEDTILTYTIRFIDNGTVLQNSNLEYGVVPQYNGAIPTREGNTFSGWDPKITEVKGDKDYTAVFTPCIPCNAGTGAECTLSVENNQCKYQTSCKAGYTGLQNATAYNPNCRIEEYKITYTLNGGENHPQNPSKYTIESGNIILQKASKTGYTFSGWTPKNTIPQGSTGNKTFTATWNINEYQLHFYTETESGTITLTGNYGDTLTAPTGFTKEGNTFSGWNPTVPSTIETGMSFQAIWKPCTPCDAGTGATCTLSVENNQCTYTTSCIDGYEVAKNAGKYNPTCKPLSYEIHYKLNGGENHPQNPKTYTIEDETITLANPTRVGHEFSMWKEGNIIPAGSTGEKTFEALWDINQYQLTFNPDNGENTTVIIGDYNSDIPPIEEPTKEGNTFLGWDKTVPTKMPANNDVFTALWNPCTPCNAGTGATCTLSVENNQCTYTTSCKAGYHKLTGTGTTTPTCTPLLWTVTYQLNDNEENKATNNPGNIKTYTVEDSDFTLLPPERKGYKFKGWLNEQGVIIETIVVSENKDRNLTAKWEANKIHITLDKDGGTGGTNELWYLYEIPTFYGDVNLQHQLSKIIRPTKAGYNFQDYYSEEKQERYLSYPDNAGNIIEFADDLHLDIDQNATLKARWTPKIIHVTLDQNGGTGGTSDFYFSFNEKKYYTDEDLEHLISKIVKPTREGYTFQDYYSDEIKERFVAYQNGNQRIELDTPEEDSYYKISHDLTLKARRKENGKTQSTHSSGGGGSSGGRKLIKDDCPDGDSSESYYDGKCSNDTKEEEKTEGTHGAADRTKEEIDIFERASEKGLTSMDTIESFAGRRSLTRAEMAKIISIFATKFMDKKETPDPECKDFEDIKNITSDLHDYIIESCNLGIMGRTPDGQGVNKKFWPHDEVTKAEAVTIISRVFRNHKYKNKKDQNRYEGHLNHLIEIGVISDDSDVDNPFSRKNYYGALKKLHTLDF